MNNQRNDNAIGERYNHWTVIGVEYNENRKEYEWICQCDCGTISRQRVYNIRSGKSKHCRCCNDGVKKLPKIKKTQNTKKSYIGEQYGELTIIDDYYDKVKKCRMVRCKCSCGNEMVTRRYKVINGKVKHCSARGHNTKMDDPKYIGQRFGKLTVIGFEYDEHTASVKWKCKCDCGNERTDFPFRIKSSQVDKCIECATKESAERASKINTRHGMSGSRIYNIWSGMIARCYNPSSDSYKYYGGRGIKICDDWRESFEAFYAWAITHGYQEDLTIDRLDFNGNYEPDNCRWATYKQQAENKRKPKPRNYLMIDGVTKPLIEWVKESDFTAPAIKYRLDVKHMSPKEAVFGERTAYQHYAKWGEDL